MPAFNYDLAGAVLAEAAFHGDGPTAARHGITTRTIQRWRQRAQDDPDLSAFVALKKRELSDLWALSVNQALDAIARYATQCAETFDKNAENLHALAGAAKILADATLTKDALDARNPGAHRPAHATDRALIALDPSGRRAS